MLSSSQHYYLSKTTIAQCTYVCNRKHFFLKNITIYSLWQLYLLSNFNEILIFVLWLSYFFNKATISAISLLPTWISVSLMMIMGIRLISYRETVMEILGLYQNEDGGFANTLDPDNWSRESSPYTTMIAVSILRTCGLTDKEHPIVQGIIRFLDSGVHCSEDGWHFTVPSGLIHHISGSCRILYEKNILTEGPLPTGDINPICLSRALFLKYIFHCSHCISS